MKINISLYIISVKNEKLKSTLSVILAILKYFKYVKIDVFNIKY